MPQPTTQTGSLFVVALPVWAAGLMTGFAAVVHMPFVIAQRYNRFRIDRVLRRRARRLGEQP